MQDEHAAECEYCDWQEIGEITPLAEPWGFVSESPDSCLTSSPEGWPWSEAGDGDDRSDDFVDEDTEVSLEEYPKKPAKHETPYNVPLVSAPGDVHEIGGRREGPN